MEKETGEPSPVSLGTNMKEQEEYFPDEMLLPALDEAASVFRENGIRTELSLGSGDAPTILLTFPDQSICISCMSIDMEADSRVFHYVLSSQGERSWSFPSIFPPTSLPAFPYLPKLYDCLRFGMPGDTSEEAAEAFRHLRLLSLQDRLSELGLTTGLVEKEDASTGVSSSLTVYTEEEEILFNYDFIFPSLSLAVLHIICGGDHIFLPECGEVPSASELSVLLPLVV